MSLSQSRWVGLSLALPAVVVGAGISRIVIQTPNAPRAIGPYSQGMLLEFSSGDKMIHTAGQIGMNTDGVLVPGGIQAEATQAMNNLKSIVEWVSGASMADVYECTVLMANLTEYAAFNEVYARYFNAAPPARAAVQVAELPKGARVEVKCSAALGPSGPPPPPPRPTGRRPVTDLS